MEILPMRDLIQDDLGNFYTASKVSGEKLLLVNAFIHHTFRRILSDDFIQDVRNKYDENVAVGQYFIDGLKKELKV